jgi:hypothetical protein
MTLISFMKSKTLVRSQFDSSPCSSSVGRGTYLVELKKECGGVKHVGHVALY